MTRHISDQLAQLGAKAHDVPLKRNGFSIVSQASYFLALRRLMQQISPDLVIGYTIKPNIFGSLAARSLGIRSASMITGLGFAFSDSGSFILKQAKRISRALYRVATTFNERVIFQNSDDLADMLSSGCLIDPSKACIVNGSGVDLDYYTPSSLPDRAVFLMVSRLLVAKGIREYADASRTLKREYPEWRFLLVGFLEESPDSISSSEFAQWRDDGIEFLGELDDIRPAMREASVYVLPSYREGTPRSVLEALAMGRPVITTNAPGCRETVVDEYNGLLVPVRDTAPLTDAMKRLGSDKGLRTRFGEAGRTFAEERFGVNSVNISLLGHLEI